MRAIRSKRSVQGFAFTSPPYTPAHPPTGLDDYINMTKSFLTLNTPCGEPITTTYETPVKHTHLLFYYCIALLGAKANLTSEPTFSYPQAHVLLIS
jgi:hypothetical protein